MTRTTRDKKKALDGQPWRDCGEKHCPWCEDDRQNVKIKAKLFIEDEEYEILKDGYIDELFDDMIKRNGL